MKRIQRKRTKGWRMPPNTVYVGRPTVWGNEFCHEDIDGSPCDHKLCLITYKTYWTNESVNYSNPDFIKRKLKGKNLACWCPLDQPCHADVLLEIANS